MILKICLLHLYTLYLDLNARIYMYMLFSVHDALLCINQIDGIKIL